MENLPKKNSRKHRGLGDDPFEDVSALIDTIISGQDAAPAKPPERPVQQDAEERSRRDAREPMVTQAVFCPHIGTEDEPTKHLPAPASTHRCFAGQRVLPVLVANQEQYCLSTNYPLCTLYQTAEQETRVAGSGDAKQGKRWGFLQRLLGRE